MQALWQSGSHSQQIWPLWKKEHVHIRKQVCIINMWSKGLFSLKICACEKTIRIIGDRRQCVWVRQRKSNWWEGARWIVAVGCLYVCVVCVAFILKQNIWEAVTQLWVEKLLQYFITAARSGIKSWKFSLSLFFSFCSPCGRKCHQWLVCVCGSRHWD